jgi:hypothetical protein
MATFEINEVELKKYVNDLITSDKNLIADVDEVYERVDTMLAKLAESPVEVIGEIIVEDIYIEAEEYDEEITDEDISEN